MGGGGSNNCRCVADTELGCCWDFGVVAAQDCAKGSQYACFIPYCWLLPCANPAGGD